MHPSDTTCGINLLLQKNSYRTTSPWPDDPTISLFEKFGDSAGPVSCRISKPYASYPVHFFKPVDKPVALEGIVYSDTISIIEQCVTDLLSDNCTAPALQILTANWSGEWCLWIQNGNQLYIVNDPLGRLPVYYYCSNNHFYTGRHLGMLADAALLYPCPKAAASILWSSYFIGHRTPYKNVYRLPGGSLVQVNLSTGEAVIAFGQPLNFDERRTQPLQQTADALADLFKQACARLATAWPGNINISLSGGQDSRAVAAALAVARQTAAGTRLAPAQPNSTTTQLFASSFTMPGAERDAALADAIAAELNIPFRIFVARENAGDEALLLQHKMGMNYTGMAFIYSFYRQMRQQHPDGFLYVTGDGGDKALPYLGEQKKSLSIDELVMQLSRRHAMTPVAQVANLTGMAVNDILQLIYEVVKSYPEQEMNNRSIHFTIYERAAQSFFEGEDRSRHFFWATTPFYDLNFFKAAMQVPDNYKKQYRIYRPFQNALNPTIAAIPDAGGHSINSWKFVLRKRVQEAFRSAPPPVKNLVRKLGSKSISINQSAAADRQQLLSILGSSTGLQTALDENAVAAFLPTANQEQYLHLRTLILLGQFYKK